MSANCFDFASSEDCSLASAGSSWSCDSASAARWTADGKTSFEDCPMFTCSFGCTPSPARFAITSLAFMFELVPEPVWKTSTGNWSSCLPSATSSPAAATRSASSPSSSSSSPFTRAAVALIRPSQRITGTGIGCPDTGKLATAFVVSPPQSSRRSSVALIRWNLALRRSRLQSPLVRGASAAQACRLGLDAAHHLAGDPAALQPTLRRAHEIAELQRGGRLAGASAVAQLLRRGHQVGADDLHVLAAGVAVEAARDRRAVDRNRARRAPQ